MAQKSSPKTSEAHSGYSTKYHTNTAKMPDIAHILAAAWTTNLNLAYTSFTALVIKNAYSFVTDGFVLCDAVMCWGSNTTLILWWETRLSAKTTQGIAHVIKAKGISMEMDNIPSLWALLHHHDLHLPTPPLVLPTGPAPYLGLIFIAWHRRRPPLPLTAHCCENVERELNCTWDSDTADKRHVQYEETQKKVWHWGC